MILAQDQEVFTELCRPLTEAQKQEFVQLADIILKQIDLE